MIVCLPYSLETFKAYNRYGEPQSYIVGDYSYLAEDYDMDFFDEDDVVTDSDDFKPGFFDEEDDEFFKSMDEERENHYDEYEQRNAQIISNTQLPKQKSIKIVLNPDGSVKSIFQEYKD